MIASFILLIGIILFGAIGFIVGYRHEEKSYNNGTCPHCGTGLNLFDHDSQGGRGYVCPECKYHVWVSYNRIDHRKR